MINMTLYKRRPSQPLKWLVALMVFALTMGLTFSDVYGHGDNPSVGVDNSDNPGQRVDDETTDLSTGDAANKDGRASPTAVPEPTTLILLAGGLSALYIARRRRQHKS